MIDNNFNGWPIVKDTPDGWSIDKTTGSPLAGHVFITNGKSVLNGQKRHLLQVMKGEVSDANPKSTPPKNTPRAGIAECKQESDSPSYDEQVSSAGFRKSVNEMARETFKLNLLRDIMCDLTICEIEGWCKTEYINQIKRMVSEIGTGKIIDANKNNNLVQI